MIWPCPSEHRLSLGHRGDLWATSGTWFAFKQSVSPDETAASTGCLKFAGPKDILRADELVMSPCVSQCVLIVFPECVQCCSERVSRAQMARHILCESFITVCEKWNVFWKRVWSIGTYFAFLMYLSSWYLRAPDRCMLTIMALIFCNDSSLSSLQRKAVMNKKKMDKSFCSTL